MDNTNTDHCDNNDNNDHSDNIESSHDSTASSSSIPWIAASVLLCICIAEGLSMNFYATITSLMLIYQFSIPTELIGYYIGYLTTAYFIGQVLSNYPLSFLSDKIGRKPMFIISILFNIICQISFGLSKWLWLAILSRFINGLTSCNLPLTKCYVREVSDIHNQARMFSFREIGFAIGSFIAPLIGSIFSRPADQKWLENTFFTSNIFVTYPYILVCIIVSLIDCLCLIYISIFMKESLSEKKQVIEIELDEIPIINTEDTEDTEDTNINDNIDNNNNNNNNNEIQIIDNDDQNTNELSNMITNDNKDNEDEDQSNNKSLSNIIINKIIYTIIYPIINQLSFLDNATLIITLLYMILSFIIMIIIQIFPVWASRPSTENGLGFEEKQVGILFSTGSMGALIFQLLLFTPIDKFFGSIISMRLGLCFMIPLIFILPFLSYLIYYNIIMWICLILCIVGFFITLSWSFGEIFVVLNNAARSDSIGKVNGLSSGLAALSRIIAPVIATSIFAYTANLNWYYPFNYMFTFHLSILVCILCIILSFAIPKYLNRNRNKK